MKSFNLISFSLLSGFLQPAIASSNPVNSGASLLTRGTQLDVCLCGDSLICPSDKPQCSPNGNKASICCASGQKAIGGKCVEPSSNQCSNGRVCSGATPQCTNDVSIYITGSAGTVAQILCCANGEKAISGKCYPGTAKLMPCYEPGVCDFGKEEYCAWNAGTGYSTCCKLDEYFKGDRCFKKK